jgi:Tol biopolymer transport system component
MTAPEAAPRGPAASTATSTALPTTTAAASSVAAGNANGRSPAIDQLTKSGIARRPAISADGTVVAYVEQQGDEFSLWIHRIAGRTDRRIVQAEKGTQIVGATVAPDASFVDYVQRKDGHLELWRVPATGASAERVVDRIDSLSAWSADGQQMAFVRVVERPAPIAILIVTDSNGRNERVLGTRRGNPLLSGLGIVARPGIRPAWSPDGRAIAVPGFERRPIGGGGDRRGAGGVNRRGLTPDSTDRGSPSSSRSAQTALIVFVDVGTGRERAVPTGLPVSDLAWLNRNTLVVDRAAEPGLPSVLWRVNEPGGQLTRLTTDSNGYSDVSVTADGSSLVSTRYQRRGTAIFSDIVLMREIR